MVLTDQVDNANWSNSTARKMFRKSASACLTETIFQQQSGSVTVIRLVLNSLLNDLVSVDIVTASDMKD